MNHFNFFVILSILIILPHINYAFFTVNILDISAARNLTCRLGDGTTLESNFQLCAIRLYRGRNSATDSTYFVYDGLRYLNIFHRYIQKYCPFWPRTGDVIHDVGLAVCHSNPVFEAFEDLQLCICATDNCNQNWNSCQNSSEYNSNLPILTNFIPDLTATIQCNATVNALEVCRQHQFIEISLCEAYVRNNSVLCAITDNGATIIQTPLIEENYEAYLEEKIYRIKSALINQAVSSETDTYVYYNYSTNNIDFINECACTTSYCNQNVITCSSKTSLLDPTTMSHTSTISAVISDTSASLVSISEATTSPVATSGAATSQAATSGAVTSPAAISEAATSQAATSGAVTSPAAISEAATSQAATSGAGTSPAAISEAATSQTATSGAVTSPIAISEAVSSQTAIPAAATSPVAISGAATTQAVPSAAATNQEVTSQVSTMAASTGSASVTPSVTNPPLVKGESGLGSAATAGIACGIIFSAVIFTAEIIILKYFFSGNTALGSGRSADYHVNLNEL